MNSQTEPSEALSTLLGLDKPQKSKKGRFLWGTGIALLVVLLIFRSLFHGSNNTSVKYQTEAVKRGDITETVSATGALQPMDQVEVGTEVSGTVKEVLADYNDRVTEGQVMARLDTTKLNTQVLQSKAALDLADARLLQAQATLSETQIKYNRLKHSYDLTGGKVPSQMDLDTAQTNLKQALADEIASKAQIAQARATLEGNQSDLAKALIRSPINGIILKRSVEPGQTVAASLQTPVLFTIARDLTVMELIVDVDEADVGRVLEGQTAVFTVDAYPDRTFPATITQVRFAPKTTSGVVTYETLLALQNTDLLLRPGMTATAEITVKQVKDVILVPNAAIRYTPQALISSTPAERGFMGRLMPRPPRRFNRPKTATVTATPKNNRIWILKNNIPEMLPVTIGATDGVMTEIVQGEIEPEYPIIIDEVVSKK